MPMRGGTKACDGSESTPSQPSYPSADPSPSMVYPMRRPDGHRPSWDITNAPGPLSVPSEFSGLGTYIDSTNPFDRVIRRELLNHLIHIYFEYMFWLMPYPHQPTMQRDLANRREEEPGQETFIAMVFSILGMVCVMPTHLTPLSPDQTSSLMAICEEQIMSYLSKREGVVLSHQRLFVAQCGAVICLCAGSPAKCRELIGSNMFIALQLNLDREATYATFDPLEAELWRRMWWLTYANDRSGATCEGARPILNEALCHSVRLPSCLTDEQLELAAQGLGSWQADPTIQSPMWGFYYCSAVWRVAGKVLTMREHDEAIAPKATEILSRVAELDMVIEELDDIFLDCPSWLMLTLDYNINSPESARASLNASTPSELSPLKQGIGVQQSNLWITQLAIRLVAVQHRKALLDLRWATPEAAALIASDPRNPDVVPRRAGFREAKLQENENKFREDRDHILTSLLRVLQALPMHQIACNAFPGLQKIRYIASTLLSDFDGLSTPSVDADEASRRSFKALTYLQEYIDYLARLEAMYAERAKGDTKM
ncbi:hypothetical protein CspeluHIS016_0211880 [Cutaneotrichosporon spelunceum]|uniref:Xylanolytic transcriptional activator regulatory domain-containing protein n=1 Tax=Cutaneotrichosporon spelunceum TaxID=1672016 RepID=A0AAD3TSN6_9TREE|nr:hypothetical protein CspeluHIS016_0211880 [Cutaneotrichosporon spelunceum]